MHVGPSTSPTATAAMVLSAKAQKDWDHQSSEGNRAAIQRWSGNKSNVHASTMALSKNASVNLPLQTWTHRIPVLLLSPPSVPSSFLFVLQGVEARTSCMLGKCSLLGYNLFPPFILRLTSWAVPEPFFLPQSPEYLGLQAMSSDSAGP